MKEEINLLYIDDEIDTCLSEYLDKYKNSQYTINYEELKFDSHEGYENLIKNEKVSKANIIIIDSKLFENNTANCQKIFGEEIKLILRKYYPFIEVIVITQNKADSKLGIIAKYSSSRGSISSLEYYKDSLEQHINKAIENILLYRHLEEKLKENTSLETVLKEKISNSILGISDYDELKKKDIDELIESFKELQGKLDVK